MERIKPFLKWAGGKYSCVHHVLHALPEAQRLVEPFTGSGAVFLNAPYADYLLGEVNADLVALYQHVKQHGQAFIDDCERLFCEENNHETPYYQFRNQFNQMPLGSSERAALFLYLNRHGYNGLCRYNLSGGYNVPFGCYQKPYFPKKELLFFHQKSQNTDFLQADFRQTFLHTRPGDIVYCDPPYVPLSKTSRFTAYTRQKFGDAEQIALADLAIKTAKNGTPVIISNHDTPLTRELYHAAKNTSLSIRRNISCNGQGRIAVRELIAVFS